MGSKKMKSKTDGDDKKAGKKRKDKKQPAQKTPMQPVMVMKGNKTRMEWRPW